MSEAESRRAGLAYAFAAYGTWGLVPIYWKWLRAVPPLELLAHRVAWSLVFVAAVLAAIGKLGSIRPLFTLRRLALLSLTTLLVGANWGLFIYAVQTHRLMHASLGYYVNPLLNVVLGVLLLGERLRRPQVLAVILAAVSVTVLTVSTGTLPWISLVLAATFAAYGLLRKLAGIDALPGLFVETLILAPVAIVWLSMHEARGLGTLSRGGLAHGLLVAASGPVTALPLLWFTAAARRLPLSTLGFLQYLSPTLQLLLAVLAYGEPLGRAQIFTFACIWVALALYALGPSATEKAVPGAEPP